MIYLQSLQAYVAYIEDNLERIERGGWTPICFAEFLMSEEAEAYAIHKTHTS